MAFYIPGKPNVNVNYVRPPQAPMTMNSVNSNQQSGASAVVVRRNLSTSSSSSRKNRGPPQNKPSSLLTPEENQIVFDVLVVGRQTLSTAVVQLLFPTSTTNPQWRLRDVGILCFVRDSTKRSYLLEILSLRMLKVIFSQEIYEEFGYRQPDSKLRFISFEGDEFMVGLSFASQHEMTDFRAILDNKMAAKRKRHIERQSRLYEQANNGTISSANMQSLISGIASPSTPPPFSAASSFGTLQRPKPQQLQYWPSVNMSPIKVPQIKTRDVAMNCVSDQPIMSSITTKPNLPNKPALLRGKAAKGRKNSFNNYNKGKKANAEKPKKSGKKEKLSKADIGCPTDFVHVEHAGFDAAKGFSNDVLNEKYKEIFNKAGISSSHLNDDETRKFIYGFIEDYEQNTVVKPRTMASSAPKNIPSPQVRAGNVTYSPSQTLPPPLPARAAVAGSPGRKQMAPVPTRQMQQEQSSQFGSSPSISPLPQFPGSNVTQVPSSRQPGTNVSSGGPPPPPPTMPSSFNGGHSNGQDGSKTFENPAEKAINSNRSQNLTPSPPPVEDERSALMAQIQQFKNQNILKKVEPGQKIPDSGSRAMISDGGNSPTSADSMDGLAGALARALAERYKPIHDSSSSEGEQQDNSESDDEWK